MEPIGLLTVAAGVACLIYGPVIGTYLLTSFMLLGAAAVSKVGGMNLLPAYFLLGFLAIDLIVRPRLFARAIAALAPFTPGFWFLMTLCYAVPASIILPRLFAGATYVFSLGQSDAGVATILQVPLAPITANITQSVYLVGEFVCFLIVSSYATRPRGLEAISSAIIFCALLNVFFAIADLVTYYTGTAEALSFIRNTSYRLMTNSEVAGFKRIVGSFTEASTFAYYTVGLFAYTFWLWLRGIAVKRAGVAAFGSLIALAFSTSSTGYVTLILILALQYVASLVKFMQARAHRHTAIFIFFGPLALALLALFTVLHSPAGEVLEHLVEITLIEKIESDSGVERSTWNAQALVAFWDTSGLGAGLGSVRASSWLIVVPASIGVFGAVVYWLFVGTVLLAPTGSNTRDIAIRTAAKMACIAQVAAASIAGGAVSLGLLFVALAAVAASGIFATRANAEATATLFTAPSRPAAASRHEGI